MTSLHIIETNVDILQYRQMLSDGEENLKLIKPISRCPPRWRSNRRKRITKDVDPDRKREQFLEDIQKATNLSFYMASSISSLDDSTFSDETKNADDSDEGDVVESQSTDYMDYLPKRAGPCYLSDDALKSRVSRWQAQESPDDPLPRSPRRRSFEIQRPLYSLSMAERRQSSDTLPVLPLRRRDSVTLIESETD